MSVQLPAASLIEVIIAMVISSVFFGLGTMVYLQILSSSLSPQKLRADRWATALIQKTREERSYLDQQFAENGLLAEKKVTLREEGKDLYQVEISIADSTHTVLIHRKQLMQLPPE
ncbi:prepilin-type N-terminal cleavage/methylation domain-containing protein [Cytophagaceae bacterium YF14B1]|uniref:Prepilin-type N-terminal cleavage/methylation domain-containing protein n=1 Tax=Xanthocytophaga flava TaxID=3048013 RepID=A0AAE3QVG0_9BACT|nr:prepilin-type N-terminal cleavage/methylation domain-containing protein [Xanthocytophaga flavus]MDJ1486105.1 prepilin-type N-terminal cleavage/methylation domain-containing protein [Xanthocytophaga flavus]